jgi:hypothetical protein
LEAGGLGGGVDLIGEACGGPGGGELFGGEGVLQAVEEEVGGSRLRTDPDMNRDGRGWFRGDGWLGHVEGLYSIRLGNGRRGMLRLFMYV